MKLNFLKKGDITYDEFSKVGLLILQSFFLGFLYIIIFL